MIIIELRAEHIPKLAVGLASLSAQDRTYFSPHCFDSASLVGLLRDGNNYYAAINDDTTLVGYGMLRTKFPDGCFRDPTLGVAVWPEHRGRGYGQQIVSLLLIEAHRKAYSCVKLKVSLENITAFRIYKKLGFKIGAQSEGGLLWMQIDITKENKPPP